MSYCKLNLGGKERGLKFNQMAIVLMHRYVDAEAHEVTSVPAIIYAGLRANDYVKRTEPDYTFEEVVDWCETLGEDDLNKAVAALTEAEAYKRLIPSEESVEKKSRKSTKKSA